MAICLLNGFAYPQHERLLAKIAQAAYPDLVISVSHQVAGEIREYERTSTTTVDAYVKPMVRRYVGRLSDEMAELGLKPQVAMMLSHGGDRSGAEQPILPGSNDRPARRQAPSRRSRTTMYTPNAVAFDMGGTTAKISVIRNGEPAVTNAFEVGHVHRFKQAVAACLYKYPQSGCSKLAPGAAASPMLTIWAC